MPAAETWTGSGGTGSGTWGLGLEHGGFYSLDQPANNGFVIVRSIGCSSLRGTNDSTVISTGVPSRILI